MGSKTLGRRNIARDAEHPARPLSPQTSQHYPASACVARGRSLRWRYRRAEGRGRWEDGMNLGSPILVTVFLIGGLAIGYVLPIFAFARLRGFFPGMLIGAPVSFLGALLVGY